MRGSTSGESEDEVEDSFKLLEDRVGRAARRLKELGSETASLRGALAEAQSRAQEAEKQLKSASKSAGDKVDTSKVGSLSRQVKTLRGEREEIRSRLGRLVELLEGLE